jgi:hypothetical protein
LETTELFKKGIGGATDIVEHEMYTLKTKGGDFLALRPELTASQARTILRYVEENHDGNVGINHDVIPSAEDFVLSQSFSFGALPGHQFQPPFLEM